MGKLTLRLRERREARSLTQGQVALRLGIHRSYVAKMEAGVRMPTLPVLWRLARYLGCSLDDLIVETPEAGEVRPPFCEK